MNRKYIMLKGNTPILFPTTLNHSDVAAAFGGKANVKSAGFWETDGETYCCYGNSYSLSMNSDPEDVDILTSYFAMR